MTFETASAAVIYQKGELGLSRISIGRNEDCDIVVEELSASRIHAELIQSDEGYILRDKNSTNGTFVIRKQERLEVKGELKLEPSDKICFGTSEPFSLKKLLYGFTDKVILKSNSEVEILEKDRIHKTHTRTKKVGKYRCPSCGSIVSHLSEACDHCFTQL